MPLVAAEPNPRKACAFRLEGGGIVMALVQKAKLPSVELTVAEHGDANRDTKTASRRKIGDLELELLEPATMPEGSIEAWMKLAEVGPTELAKRTVDLIQLGPPDYLIPVQINHMTGVFPKKIEEPEFDRKSDDNAIKKVTFSVDDMTRVL